MRRAIALASAFATILYFNWRVIFSVPTNYGQVAVAANVVLLAMELLSFVITLVHYKDMLGMRERPLPDISGVDYPEVDIFIATYDESPNLLYRTVNACMHLKYPDKSKLHIWICDDNRRSSVRRLARELGVGYFDRPDNEGAKAGNLNHALALTNAPYVVTLDADMIPRSDFLLKTIPYFLDVERRSATLPDGERVSLGFVQTPQSFYQPDVFQHSLYAENRVPDDQCSFYRSTEIGRVHSNSVVYGGSNTVLSRAALEAAGGFFTESITEDFATGMLIEAAGFISLATVEPLASGRTPHLFREYLEQRKRWWLGSIITARKLGLARRGDLSLSQKLSYWNSVVNSYLPFRNMLYMLLPVSLAIFGIPVLSCDWLELLLYWLPMFVLQDVASRVLSGNTVSMKWNAIYETAIMPYLLVPVMKESFGISAASFKVTDKSAASSRRPRDVRLMMPFIVLLALSVAGIVRLLPCIHSIREAGLIVLLVWMVRNLYFLLMSLSLADGRASDGEPVHVLAAESITVRSADGGAAAAGVTTHLTEHAVEFTLSGECRLERGEQVEVRIESGDYRVTLSATLVDIQRNRHDGRPVYAVELGDFDSLPSAYFQILYDRIPTYPQNLDDDLGALSHLGVNVARRAIHGNGNI